jgi:hypothetical protein
LSKEKFYLVIYIKNKNGKNANGKFRISQVFTNTGFIHKACEMSEWGKKAQRLNGLEQEWSRGNQGKSKAQRGENKQMICIYFVWGNILLQDWFKTR